ncbi:MAG TPA: hypothetical protein VEY90_00960 [Thermoleophilaceae bacterium]|nr:hypothetical protein [Thermoleophilaceae bacterium]
MESSDRYESMPDLTRLPGWLWRRLPPWGRLALVCLPVAAIALALLLGPGIEKSKEERARAEAERIARERAERTAEARRAQRPRFGAATPAPSDQAGRARLVQAVAADVRADARRRVAAGALTGPIRRVECEPFPRSESGVGAEQDLGERHGRYSCLAVTAEFGASGERDAYAASESGAIGHPYRARVDFTSGRYAFCKVSGRAGEGGLSARLTVTVPRVCGGR